MKNTVYSSLILLGTLLTSSAAAQTMPVAVDTPTTIFEQGYIQVVAESASGQARHRAKRAARVIAQRDMLEILKGIQLRGKTSVGDGMVLADTVETSVKGFLQGAVVVSEQYMPEDGYARVALRLNLRGNNSLYGALGQTLQSPPAQLNFPPAPVFRPSTPANVLNQSPDTSGTSGTSESSGTSDMVTLPDQPTQQAPSQPFDGLIVIVKNTGFRPALACRIITEKEEVLFGPSKVASQWLVERGCGGFTTTLDKAKALLASWGSTNPLVVTSNTVHNESDAVVSQQDATAIFTQDQKTTMLAQARVVFVL